MRIDALEKHIFDTIKEWQMKIGYREESMKLYYPRMSLTELLGLDDDISDVQLDETLSEFTKTEKSKLGEIEISSDRERYCITISEKGCAYIAKNVPEFVFLKRFLEVITKQGNTLEQIRNCFEVYAKECNTQYTELDKRKEGLGYVFFFDKEEVDACIYCVEEDEFGLTYHRFIKSDYEKISEIHKA